MITYTDQYVHSLKKKKKKECIKNTLDLINILNILLGCYHIDLNSSIDMIKQMIRLPSYNTLFHFENFIRKFTILGHYILNPG